jgi:hypothetical protein
MSDPVVILALAVVAGVVLVIYWRAILTLVLVALVTCTIAGAVALAETLQRVL